MLQDLELVPESFPNSRLSNDGLQLWRDQDKLTQKKDYLRTTLSRRQLQGFVRRQGHLHRIGNRRLKGQSYEIPGAPSFSFQVDQLGLR
jgi:hypothetical protein